jgi:PAS domain S-box-containing protein
MKSTLEKRILLFAFITLTLTITVNTVLNIEGFRRDYRDGIIRRSQGLAEGLKMSIENVLALGLDLAGINGISERCIAIVETDPEISYCIVEDSVGIPLYASDPRFRFTNDVELVSSISKSTSLLEFPHREKYYDVSLSIYGVVGELSGRIRIGFSEMVLQERIRNILQRSLVVLGIAFFVVFTVVFLFTKKDLIGPISRLCSVAKDIASGNFNVTVPVMSTRDFSELGDALEDMARSLKERDEKIQNSYAELEQTNLQLQDSYENLEKIGTELGRSREMYRSLLEDASDAIVVSDEEDRIVLINKVAENFFGVSREQAGGRNIYTFLELLQSENVEEFYALHSQVLKGETLETEIRFTSPGENRPVIGWIKASPVAGRDGRRRVQSIIRDVTREREIKENLQRSTDELKRLNQMKDSFLGVASHELKTPLTVIVGYAELMLTDMSDQLDPAILAMMEHIANAADRLSSIVRDMVDVSMLEYQRLQLRKRPVEINQVVEKATRELEFFFTQRKQQLLFNLQQGLPVISCDPDRIGQIIGNLVGNAIKFTPDSGTVQVSTRLVACLRSPELPADEVVADGSAPFCPIALQKFPYVQVVISDSGIGIDPKDQPHVFDKFYEVGNIEEHFTGKVAFKGKGTGLGLTIVKGIVDLHGGEVWVESSGNDPDGCPGSAFHFILPVNFDDSHWGV